MEILANPPLPLINNERSLNTVARLRRTRGEIITSFEKMTKRFKFGRLLFWRKSDSD